MNDDFTKPLVDHTIEPSLDLENEIKRLRNENRVLTTQVNLSNKEKIQTMLRASREEVGQMVVSGAHPRNLLFSEAWGQAFAESILKECFDIIDKQADHLDGEFERGRADDLRAVSNIIKQHFGIGKT